MTQVEPVPAKPRAKERSKSNPSLPASSAASKARPSSSGHGTYGAKTGSPAAKNASSTTVWIWAAVAVVAMATGVGGAWLGGAFTTKSKETDASKETKVADAQPAPKPVNAAVVAVPPSQNAMPAPAVTQAGANPTAVPSMPPPSARGKRRAAPAWSADPSQSADPRFSQRSNPFVHHTFGAERDDNSLLLKLVRVPRGQFLMGDKEESGQEPVPVRVSKDFWIGKYEVTQLQWRQVMQTSPWSGHPDVKEGNDYPATYLSWQDAVQFCEKLSEDERSGGRLPYGMKFDLPTEAQWEFACRAGSATRFSFGDDEAELPNYAWFGGNASAAGQDFAHPVGQRQPNRLNVFDMHGNVSEWCRDIESSPLLGGLDPEITSGGTRRVSRGGSVADPAKECRAAGRRGLDPSQRDHALGFRVALVAVARSTPWGSTRTMTRPPEFGSRPGGAGMRSSVLPESAPAVPVKTRDDNALKLPLVHIPAGVFQMGAAMSRSTRSMMERQQNPLAIKCPPPAHHRRSEPPQRLVRTGHPLEFWLGKNEVTQAEWQQVMKTAPWHGKDQVMEGATYPAIYVSFNDVLAFVKKLTESEHQAGRLPSDSSYALPTEAQWEYACRAGTLSQYSCGDSQQDLADYAWFCALQKGSAEGQPYAHEVGSKGANPWGLCDMHGNVCEWCSDRYKDKLPGGINPEVTGSGSAHVIRGGSWLTPAMACGSSNRGYYVPTIRRNDLGFRVALVSSGGSGGRGAKNPALQPLNGRPRGPLRLPKKRPRQPRIKSQRTKRLCKKESTPKLALTFAGNKAGRNSRG